jgi:hypothetical protein
VCFPGVQGLEFGAKLAYTVNLGRWLARHRLVLLAGFAFVIFGHVALIALPLSALLVMSSPQTRRELIAAAIAGGLSIAWLMTAGDLPDQTVRAGAVIATAVYVSITRFLHATLIHRSLIAVAASAVTLGALLFTLGSSWGELHWWVEYQVGYTARLASRMLWLVGGPADTGGSQLGSWIGSSVQFMADYFGGILALQLIAGLCLATAVYHRLARRPHGPQLGRFRDFRFSEHLGWVTIAALLAFLLPQLATFRLAAVNVLLVMGTLYGLRGVAVAVFGLQLLAGGNPLIAVVAGLAAALMLPIALACAILLGVVDSGLDLRRRWHTPRVN